MGGQVAHLLGLAGTNSQFFHQPLTLPDWHSRGLGHPSGLRLRSWAARSCRRIWAKSVSARDVDRVGMRRVLVDVASQQKSQQTSC